MNFCVKAKSSQPNQNVVTSAKFLGIFIDHQLSWSNHIDYLSTRLSRVLFKLNEAVLKSYIKTAYFCLFSIDNQVWFDTVKKLYQGSGNFDTSKKGHQSCSKSRILSSLQTNFLQLNILTLTNLYIFDLISYLTNHLKFLSGEQNYEKQS